MSAQPKPTIDEILDHLRGPRENFRRILEDKDALLAAVCRYAEIRSRREKVPAWSIIGNIFGHGSGVSSAIYELYRPRPVCVDGVEVPA